MQEASIRTEPAGSELAGTDPRLPGLAATTCARRLAPLGVQVRTVSGPAAGEGRLELAAASEAEPDVALGLSWHGPAAVEPECQGSEATVQATVGLMQVHGRDSGRPRRLGLEVASVAAGVLAAQGTLAALIGTRRGRPPSSVETSVLQAGLLLVSHSVAAATAGEEWVPAPPATEPGPPFASSDGHWFEIETLDPEAWKRFWALLGAEGADLGRAWTLFRSRYYRGTCTLPPGLHRTTAAHTLASLREAAEACEVSLCPLRSYDEVLRQLGRWHGHPSVRMTAPAPYSGGLGPAADAIGDLPLAGIRVVEATSRLQGPLAGLLLRMLGAEVTKVEPPGGDIGRMVPPLAGDTGSFFSCFNRGKRPVELDLSRSAGRTDLAELVAGADIFLHNWRPGKADEWGLDPGHLAAQNPRLVYVEASGWGDVAEASHLVGTDYLVQAYTAAGQGLSPEDEPAFPSRALLTDYMGALNTCEGMLSGLYLRERTGRGCTVGTSMLGGAMAMQAHVLEDLALGQESGRRNGRPLWSVLDHPVETVDGYLVVTAGDHAAFHLLCQGCGVDPRDERAVTERLVLERLSADPAAEWEARLSGMGLAVAAARTDLAGLPRDSRLGAMFEPLAGLSWAPISPWSFRP